MVLKNQKNKKSFKMKLLFSLFCFCNKILEGCLYIVKEILDEILIIFKEAYLNDNSKSRRHYTKKVYPQRDSHEHYNKKRNMEPSSLYKKSRHRKYIER